ncbi:MAG: SUMF1/EgtB/PvdO family nonheme iron enzyme [Acidobacteria bacterium]|nr:SUMF1/EgtB/PvdO family nonheme iron enzyme [Acidobacteriota bacterium]
MKTGLLIVSLFLVTTSAMAAINVWVPHVTNVGGWTTVIKMYNPGYTAAEFTAQKYDVAGNPVGAPMTGSWPERAWGEIGSSYLDHEGSVNIHSSWNYLVKVEYRYGSTPSVCEFFLSDYAIPGWILPTSARSWLDYTGLAVLNTDSLTTGLTVEGWKDGVKVAPDFHRDLASREKFVALSDQLWTGIGYSDLDTLVVRSTAIQAPMSITGNFAGDRHLFFAGQYEPIYGKPGDVPLSGQPPDADSAPESVTFWCAHVTAVGGWKTSVQLYNATSSTATYSYAKYDTEGHELGNFPLGLIPARAWAEIPHTVLNYEGTVQISGSDMVLAKSTYQFGDSPSVCEFYLSTKNETNWVIPNSVRSWMNYTGLALVNSTDAPIEVNLEAWKNGKMVAWPVRCNLAARSKYVNLSNQIWSGIDYNEVDTLIARSSSAITAPISITGNNAGDRHLFFAGQAEPDNGNAGDPVGPDPLIGPLRFIPRGLYVQGSPTSEPCRQSNETQFTHLINTKFAAMETEVSRRMWADLKTVQPTLPDDPSEVWLMQSLDYPVQNVSWNHAVLFANLLSVQNGFQPCYFKDFMMLVPVSASNYQTGATYWRSAATGYRLPTEGEWEYLCRAGTSTPFWIVEPAYSAANCGNTGETGYDQLETAAWFKANGAGKTNLCGFKAANPWGLCDVHGNVHEWCWDWFGTYPTGGQVDYHGPSSGEFGDYRVLRGGSWDQAAQNARSAYRGSINPAASSNLLGFRLVRTLP